MSRGRTPNRLIREASPYLQQHAYNPVDWYPWGDEALRKARDEDKPIFLSVGYSACHWCHVMERECFDNPEIAAILNQHFVNIKVDREERPDIDHLYQSVCQMVTRSGGWPLSVFLTPDLRPFYVGTYFPPTDRYGRPGFPRLCLAIAQAWRERRQEVERVAAEWTRALRDLQEAVTPPGMAGPPDREVIVRALRDLMDSVDRRYGGFGGAPKFPNAPALDFMLRAAAATGNREAAELVAFTCRQMAAGGIYDQLGGGFHRYAVDARWAVPHFEKMLYDQALLVPVYLGVWQCTGDSLFARIAGETLDYVQREMTHPEGGFYSATDADSEGEEGKFFVWTPAQVKAVLGEEEGELLCRHLGVTETGNFEGGTTVLHIAAGPEELAAALGRPAAEIAARLEAGRRRLYAARQQRVPPFRDEKVLTGWNGLMISAFARAARILRDEGYAASARRAAAFVLDRLQADSRLLRRFKDGQAGIPGYLEDYAYLVAGLIDLYEATFEERWLGEAVRLHRAALDLFWDEGGGGFYLTPAGAADLIARPRDAYDSALPAPGSVAVMNGLRLLPFTGEERFRAVAEATFQAYRLPMERVPLGMASLLSAYDLYLESPTEVTLVAPGGPAEAAEWLDRLGRRYLPRLVLTCIRPEQAEAADGIARALTGRDEVPPIWAGKTARDGRLTGYVCRHFACSAPVTDYAQLERLLG